MYMYMVISNRRQTSYACPAQEIAAHSNKNTNQYDLIQCILNQLVICNDIKNHLSIICINKYLMNVLLYK